MSEYEGTTPLCPLRNFNPCHREKCAWWAEENKMCSLHSIAFCLQLLAERAL